MGTAPLITPKNAVVQSKWNGYDFDETSPAWNTFCSTLPCFAGLQWPGYETWIVEDKIDGEPAVIQLWKGYCQQFMGRADFPGGIGGEVGVYRRVKKGTPPPNFDDVPALFKPGMMALAAMAGDHYWWPDKKLAPQMSMTLINPRTRNVLLRRESKNTYWCNKWMQTTSYARYKKEHDDVPPRATDYEMVFTVGDKTYHW